VFGCFGEVVGFCAGFGKNVEKSNVGTLNRVKKSNELKRVVKSNVGSLKRLLNIKFKLVTRF